MGHNYCHQPGLGLVLTCVFALLFSVFATVALAQSPAIGEAVLAYQVTGATR
jgi:hypothetical protein